MKNGVWLSIQKRPSGIGDKKAAVRPRGLRICFSTAGPLSTGIALMAKCQRPYVVGILSVLDDARLAAQGQHWNS